VNGKQLSIKPFSRTYRGSNIYRFTAFPSDKETLHFATILNIAYLIDEIDEIDEIGGIG
jgi:hypothetical protein